MVLDRAQWSMLGMPLQMNYAEAQPSAYKRIALDRQTRPAWQAII